MASFWAPNFNKVVFAANSAYHLEMPPNDSHLLYSGFFQLINMDG